MLNFAFLNSLIQVKLQFFYQFAKNDRFVPGMWSWQGTNQTSESGPGSSGSGGGGPNSAGPPGNPPQTHELSDMMMQMLDQGAASSFEDLNMFNTSFE